MMDLLTEMQQTLCAVKDKVTDIDTCMEGFEAMQATLERELSDLKSAGQGLPTKSTNRARIVPPSLAVNFPCHAYYSCIQIFHSLPRVKYEESITLLIQTSNSSRVKREYSI